MFYLLDVFDVVPKVKTVFNINTIDFNDVQLKIKPNSKAPLDDLRIEYGIEWNGSDFTWDDTVIAGAYEFLKCTKGKPGSNLDAPLSETAQLYKQRLVELRNQNNAEESKVSVNIDL
jgi:hypothetical protein